MLDRYMASVGRDPALAYDGLDLVVVGRSTNVGKPAAILGLARNATVISAHKHTADAGRLAEHTRMADLLIVAAGVPGLITGGFVREGAIVVDIGINAVPAARRDDAARRRRRHRERAARSSRRCRPCRAASGRSPTCGCCATRSSRRGWRAARPEPHVQTSGRRLDLSVTVAPPRLGQASSASRLIAASRASQRVARPAIHRAVSSSRSGRTV